MTSRGGRRPKTNRVPRTRAGGQWTEAAMWGFLRSALRQASLRWPPIADAMKSVRRPYHGPNKRRKWEYQCAVCQEWHEGKAVQVDHIQPAGQLLAWTDLPQFCERLFCEGDGLRVLCKGCHNNVTQGKG